jgi:hypothetical protein
MQDGRIKSLLFGKFAKHFDKMCFQPTGSSAMPESLLAIFIDGLCGPSIWKNEGCVEEDLSKFRNFVFGTIVRYYLQCNLVGRGIDFACAASQLSLSISRYLAYGAINASLPFQSRSYWCDMRTLQAPMMSCVDGCLVGIRL